MPCNCGAFLYCVMRTIEKATPADIERLVKLVNSAYRGEEAKKGWTHEADLISGTVRIDEQSLHEIITKENAAILKCTENNMLVGCVYLEKRNEDLYLGMLSVAPDLQGAGIGKQLLQAAEAYAREIDCTAISMNVISVRNELIQWYRKYGYWDSGERKPFPDDDRFGKPREPIEFAIFKKEIKPLDIIQ